MAKIVYDKDALLETIEQLVSDGSIDMTVDEEVLVETVQKELAKHKEDVQGMLDKLDKHGKSIEQMIAAGFKKIVGDVKQIEVKHLASKKTKKLGFQHALFERLMTMAQARVNTMLVGPAGGGKTHVCHSIAKALDLPFYFIAVGNQTTKSDLLGYMDANGKYVKSVLREAYEEGGVFLLDEIDAGNANSLTIMNAMLANGIAYFPDKMVKRHRDFVFFCAANTFGRGADRMYVGRNQLDAATLDRFCVVNFDYDEDLEKRLSPNQEWVEYVQQLRRAAFDLKERVVISPRATIFGTDLLTLGIPKDDVCEMVIWKGISLEIKTRVIARAMSMNGKGN